MLSNLVGNAIKFTPSGRVKIDAKEITSEGKPSLLEFAVSDTGIGVPASKIHCFSNHFLNRTIPSHVNMVGLAGPSIVSSLAKSMGGDVGVSSELAKVPDFGFGRPHAGWVRGMSSVHLNNLAMTLRSPHVCAGLLWWWRTTQSTAK